MSIRLEFKIQFKSDFHVGAGHGLGLQVDSALLRDADKVPVIRGTILTGLLRESLQKLVSLKPFQMQQLCQASGNEDGHQYCGQFSPNPSNAPNCPVCSIFGSPRAPKRWRISSARPNGLEAPQESSAYWKAGKTASQITTRMRVNPRTRRAEESKLFTREEGDSSVCYRFVAECLTDDEQSRIEEEWVLAAARALRHLGASKRRGMGECDIHLVDNPAVEKKLLDRFELRMGGKVPRIPTSTTSIDLLPELSPSDQADTYRVRILLRTDEPLLIAKRAEAGNQFETLEYIPGSAWWGALAGRTAHRFGKNMVNPESDQYATFVNFFFRDAIRFSHLLPVKLSNGRDQGYPTIPAPLDFVSCELYEGYEDEPDNGHGVFSIAWNDHPRDNCPVCKEQSEAQGKVKLKQVRGFLPLNRDGLTTKFNPKQTSEMHIQIQPKTGRVNPSDLYGFVALETGQFFAGEVTCSSKTVWDALCKAAGLNSNPNQINEMRLGKASRRGYGKVSFFWQPIDNQVPRYGMTIDKRVTDPHKVIMTLLSDTIITDSWGRFVRGFDESWLKSELGLFDSTGLSVDKQRRFSAVRVVDAFNNKWGLPRARDIALVAGSTVRLNFSGIEVAELQALLNAAEANGIGLRRHEGFGRVSFNHPIYQQLDRWQGTDLSLSSLKLVTSGNRSDVEEFIEEWEEELNNLCQKEWNKLFAATPKHAKHFEAVARLLHIIPLATATDIRGFFQYLGRPSQILLGKTLDEVKVSRSQVENFFQTEGKEGMIRLGLLKPSQKDKDHDSFLHQLEILVSQFENTEQKIRNNLWRIALQMLAERISTATKTQRGES